MRETEQSLDLLMLLAFLILGIFAFSLFKAKYITYLSFQEQKYLGTSCNVNNLSYDKNAQMKWRLKCNMRIMRKTKCVHDLCAKQYRYRNLNYVLLIFKNFYVFLKLGKEEKMFFHQPCYFNNVPLFEFLTQITYIRRFIIRIVRSIELAISFHKISLYDICSTLDYDQPSIRDHAMYETIYVIRIRLIRATCANLHNDKTGCASINQNSDNVAYV